MNYKIAYIDEDNAWINTFYQTFKDDFDIVKIQVGAGTTLEGIMKQIFDNNLDGVVTDFLLDESGIVNFNGNAIVDSIQSYKPYFPIIMLTSYEPQAISQMNDVNIINGKDILDGEHEEQLEVLKSKIKSNIDRYYSKIKNTQDRIEILVRQKNDKSIQPNEEQELAKLFILMDELEPEGKTIPANLIAVESITQLNEFITQTKSILEELKKRNANE